MELHQERPDGTRTAVSQFTITRALSTALRYIRARSGNLPPIFVDQICIDQGRSAAAKTENGQQINLMGDIYRHCTRVVAWLGIATPQTDAFFDFAVEITHHQCEGLVFNSERSAAVFSVAIQRKRNAVFDADKVLQRDMPQMVALARRYWPVFPHRGAQQRQHYCTVRPALQYRATVGQSGGSGCPGCVQGTPLGTDKYGVGPEVQESE
ncbi:hypothetical protein B0T26DRAFT_750835 [Lasiosphaeria miniovina]|uniref:Heterokaryon incompatibility domain-containing protein n=1 Tax=Lasiosphaeria miniovina TaxID=1954250 RepID=A0AA40AX11_9PEZI|nr:uncharacterized protein B0T26DRAFT_750835 [Lasiosphaeria miniovina]KAK0723572.1 hypothetical protein B0T26DRAFT_750835 [Lasiosphaeria miniovina]